MAQPEKILVITTVSSEEIAIELSQELLENNHAACINILPKVRSIYRWKGEICDDRESFLVIKTRADHFKDVKSLIAKIGGYECPEILAFKVDKGGKQFLEWIDAVLDTE